MQILRKLGCEMEFKDKDGGEKKIWRNKRIETIAKQKIKI